MKKTRRQQQSQQDAAVEADAPEAPEASGSAPEAGSEAAAGQEPQVDWRDRFLRAKADFANMQRRAGEEQRSAVRYANSDFARGLLDIVDDLNRTMQAALEAEGTKEQLLEGVRLIHEKFLKQLRNHHVEPIEALEKPFNPQFHEALMQQPSSAHEPNTVIQEVQTGYTLHDRVLRPSRVIVSTAAEPLESNPQHHSED